MPSKNWKDSPIKKMNNTMKREMSGTNLSVSADSAVFPSMLENQVTTWFVVIIVVCVTGAFANFLLLKAILGDPVLRKGSGVLVIHTLVLQTFTTGVAAPFYATMFYGHMVWKWYIPDWSCKYWFVIFAGCSYARNWSDLTLAANRFVAVSLPHSYNRFRSSKAIAINIVVVWAACAILVFLPAFEITGVYRVAQYGACGYVQMGAGGGLRQAFALYVPLVTTGILYLAMLGKLAYDKRSRSKISSVTGETRRISTANARSIQHRMNLAWSLIVTYLWLCASYLPGNVVALYFNHDPSTQMLFVWLRTVALWAPSLDPVILVAVNKPYRQACVRLWRTRKANHFRPAVGTGPSDSNVQSRF